MSEMINVSKIKNLRNFTPGKRTNIDFNMDFGSKMGFEKAISKTTMDLMITMTHRKNGCLWQGNTRYNTRGPTINTSNYDASSMRKTAITQ